MGDESGVQSCREMYIHIHPGNPSGKDLSRVAVGKTNETGRFL